jgi:hypothetical protein
MSADNDNSQADNFLKHLQGVASFRKSNNLAILITAFVRDARSVLANEPELKTDPTIVTALVGLAMDHSNHRELQKLVFDALNGGSDAQREGFIQILHQHPHLHPAEESMGATVARAAVMRSSIPCFKIDRSGGSFLK